MTTRIRNLNKEEIQEIESLIQDGFLEKEIFQELRLLIQGDLIEWLICNTKMVYGDDCIKRFETVIENNPDEFKWRIISWNFKKMDKIDLLEFDFPNSYRK